MGVSWQMTPQGGSPNDQAVPLNRFSLMDSLQDLMEDSTLFPEKRTCAKPRKRQQDFLQTIPGPKVRGSHVEADA